MHEATVALSILKRALATVDARVRQEEKAATQASLEDSDKSSSNFDVIKIVVNVGEFRNIDSESLEFTFNALRKDFPLTKNAQLEIRKIGAIAECSVLNHEFHPGPDNHFSCTICGGGIGKLVSGKELEIVNIELEQRFEETAA